MGPVQAIYKVVIFVFCQKIQHMLQQSHLFPAHCTAAAHFSAPKGQELKPAICSFAQMAVCLLQDSKCLGLHRVLVLRGCTPVLIIDVVCAVLVVRVPSAPIIHKAACSTCVLNTQSYAHAKQAKYTKPIKDPGSYKQEGYMVPYSRPTSCTN